MRACKRLVIVLAVLASALASTTALARGYHRHHFGSGLALGLVLGAPLWYPAPAYPYPYSYPYAYPYPPAVVVNPAPRVYVEREDQPLAQSAPGYWYYCRESNVYYPYVRECAGPWERVPAAPQTP